MGLNLGAVHEYLLQNLCVSILGLLYRHLVVEFVHVKGVTCTLYYLRWAKSKWHVYPDVELKSFLNVSDFFQILNMIQN